MWSSVESWSRQAAGARALLRAANGLGSRVAEALWSASSAAAGGIFHPRVRRWASAGRERVVVIAPHPDDEAAGCAGTLIRHQEAGDSVSVAVITDGSRSRALGFDSSGMAEQRQREAGEAAAQIGAQLHWIGLREGDWADHDGRAAIDRALANVGPTIVYAPSNVDFHPEHRRVAAALAETLSVSALKPEVRIYAIQVPLTPLLTNMIHDVSDLEGRIRSMFGCYASQRISLTSSFRARRYAASFYRANRIAEGFCTMPTELYVALHTHQSAGFRPMGIRAWTDPLTLMVGARERLRWSRRRSRTN